MLLCSNCSICPVVNVTKIITVGTRIASPVTALSAYKSFYINIFRQKRFSCTDTHKPTQTCFAQKLIQMKLCH